MFRNNLSYQFIILFSVLLDVGMVFASSGKVVEQTQTEAKPGFWKSFFAQQSKPSDITHSQAEAVAASAETSHTTVKAEQEFRAVMAEPVDRSVESIFVPDQTQVPSGTDDTVKAEQSSVKQTSPFLSTSTDLPGQQEIDRLQEELQRMKQLVDVQKHHIEDLKVQEQSGRIFQEIIEEEYSERLDNREKYFAYIDSALVEALTQFQKDGRKFVYVPQVVIDSIGTLRSIECVQKLLRPNGEARTRLTRFVQSCSRNANFYYLEDAKMALAVIPSINSDCDVLSSDETTFRSAVEIILSYIAQLDAGAIIEILKFDEAYAGRPREVPTIVSNVLLSVLKEKKCVLGYLADGETNREWNIVIKGERR